MDTPDIQPENFQPPSRWRAFREKVGRWGTFLVDFWRRGRAFSRWVGIALLGAGGVIFLAKGILLLQPRPESLDDFIARFNDAVEKNDETAFDTLIHRAVFDQNSSAYLRGVEFLRKLNAERKQIAPLEKPVEPNTNAVFIAAEVQNPDEDQALLTFDQNDERLTFQLAREGWRRRWYIRDVTVSEPAPSAAKTTTSSEGEESSSEVLAAGFGVGGEGTPLDTEFKLKQILEAWRAAWENKEIDAYMAWYADYATIRRVTVVQGREIPEILTKEQLRTRMERLARTYTSIQVNISNVTVQGDYAEAGINFLQEYTAKKSDGEEQVFYQDVGIKTLRFVNENGEWKIHDEDWRSYVNVPQYPIK